MDEVPHPYLDSLTQNASSFLKVTGPCIFRSQGDEIIDITVSYNSLDNNLIPEWRNISKSGGTFILKPSPCVFEIDTTWMQMLGNAIKQVLSGTCAGSTSKVGSASKYRPISCDTEKLWLQNFAENDNATYKTILDRFEDISTSLNSRMREIGLNWSADGKQRGYAKGWASTSTICTQFDWE
ncbi:hypothetical protein QBC38DRAFT_525534 [Podospora fimiseda]|uniref:Uncharacterized protein n=1 Tax=Podospora fimiseda TaxID=252190 RepID=A0AAN7BEB4_9PEZI|nr:hypothetical protein QBC38DRAFT_525534 [Podospora fimiseda]